MKKDATTSKQWTKPEIRRLGKIKTLRALRERDRRRQGPRPDWSSLWRAQELPIPLRKLHRSRPSDPRCWPLPGPWGDTAHASFQRLSPVWPLSPLGIGGHAGTAEIGRLQLACRPLSFVSRDGAEWRPAILPSGKITLFHGYFDNSRAYRRRIGRPIRATRHSSMVWPSNDGATRPNAAVIGEYCAVIVDPDMPQPAPVTKPLAGPAAILFPRSTDLAAVASVPPRIVSPRASNSG